MKVHPTIFGSLKALFAWIKNHLEKLKHNETILTSIIHYYQSVRK